MALPKTYVYIDGFNLYHGAVEHTCYKWLDIRQLCEKLLPKNDIAHIRYFTSPSKDTLSDPDRSVRQRIYWRALDTLPGFSRPATGNFTIRPRRFPLAPPRRWDDPNDPDVVFLEPGGPTSAVILHQEEKGADVNLAAWLLVDAFRKRFEVAVVMSNDADLVEPIRIVSRELSLPVGIVNPRPHNFQKRLANLAAFKRNIDKSLLRRCQFPPTLEDERGSFSKPTGW